MKSIFERSAGSVVGQTHLQSGKNNQDAFTVLTFENLTIAVVCDGCGSSAHSEVGAQLGARLMVSHLAKHFRGNEFEAGSKQIRLGPEMLERVRLDVLAELRVLVNRMGGSFSQTVSDYFLFTVVGVVMTPAATTVFSLGDGFVAINGDIEELGPFPGNTPPYLSYGLTGSALEDSNPDLLRFRIIRQIATERLHSVLIGTDGVGDLAKLETANLPGKTEPVGPISQFWDEDRFFENPDGVRRRLAQINTDFRKPDWENRRLKREPGLLADDTTLVVIRRKQFAM